MAATPTPRAGKCAADCGRMLLSRPWAAPTGGVLTKSPGAGHRALRRGRASLPGQIYLLTTTTRHRQPFFTRFPAACAAARCFAHAGLLADARMLAWVLMPDHVHWLLQLGAATPIDELVIRLKSASARQVNRVLARTGPLWSTAYHDHALREEDDLRAAARYLIANPLRAGLVQRVGDYPFWDAVWM